MANPFTASPDPRPRPTLLRCIIVTILALVILAGLITLIFYLAVRPSPIQYSVDDVRVNVFNLTGNNLNATFELTLQARNRNRHVSLYYDSVDVTVWYADQMVAFSEVDPFFQPRRNETFLHVTAVAQETPLMGSVAQKLKHDRTGGEAELEVHMKARVRFKVGVTKTKHYTLKVFCSPVLVYFSSKVPFEKTYCDVDT